MLCKLKALFMEINFNENGHKELPFFNIVNIKLYICNYYTSPFNFVASL